MDITIIYFVQLFKKLSLKSKRPFITEINMIVYQPIK